MVKRLATSETQIVTVKNWFDESRAVGSYELGVPRKYRFGSRAAVAIRKALRLLPATKQTRRPQSRFDDKGEPPLSRVRVLLRCYSKQISHFTQHAKLL